MSRKKKALPLVKMRNPFVKFLAIFFGILFIATAVVALILSFFLFWEASCNSCASYSCDLWTGSTQGPGPMDWSFLWFDVYFIVGVIVGIILLVVGSNMATLKSYLKKNPNAIICMKCKRVARKGTKVCTHCGASLEELYSKEVLGEIVVDTDLIQYSDNPYEEFKRKQAEAMKKQQDIENKEE